MVCCVPGFSTFPTEKVLCAQTMFPNGTVLHLLRNHVCCQTVQTHYPLVSEQEQQTEGQASFTSEDSLLSRCFFAFAFVFIQYLKPLRVSAFPPPNQFSPITSLLPCFPASYQHVTVCVYKSLAPSLPPCVPLR